MKNIRQQWYTFVNRLLIKINWHIKYFHILAFVSMVIIVQTAPTNISNELLIRNIRKSASETTDTTNQAFEIFVSKIGLELLFYYVNRLTFIIRRLADCQI